MGRGAAANYRHLNNHSYLLRYANIASRNSTQFMPYRVRRNSSYYHFYIFSVTNIQHSNEGIYI